MEGYSGMLKIRSDAVSVSGRSIFPKSFLTYFKVWHAGKWRP